MLGLLLQLYLNYTLISEELALYLSAIACFSACSYLGLCTFLQVCRNVIYKSFSQSHVVYSYGFIVLLLGAVTIILVPLQFLSASCYVNKKLSPCSFIISNLFTDFSHVEGETFVFIVNCRFFCFLGIKQFHCLKDIGSAFLLVFTSLFPFIFLLQF